MAINTIKTIGIVGGGQLGRMTAIAASQLGYKTVVFSDQPDSCAAAVTNHSIIADYRDKKALEAFARAVEVSTFEFENIPSETLEILSSKVAVYPKPDILRIAQNRLLEKQFLNSIAVKTVEFAEIINLADLKSALQSPQFRKSILKTASGGYDGKGQFSLRAKMQLPQINFDRSFILESCCDFKQEVSVLVARSANKEIVCYEPIENFHKNGILDKSIYPAKLTKKTITDLQLIAKKIARKLDLVGVLAVEFFITKKGELLVNELAPRPHNSYHFSIDAALTSQFEQLIRAIVGLPFGDTQFKFKGYMKNLIGEEALNVSKFLKHKDAKLHLYGKGEARPGRKMGHVNFLFQK